MFVLVQQLGELLSVLEFCFGVFGHGERHDYAYYAEVLGFLALFWGQESSALFDHLLDIGLFGALWQSPKNQRVITRRSNQIITLILNLPETVPKILEQEDTQQHKS